MLLMMLTLVAQTPDAGAAPVKEKKVCRKEEVMGSNIPKLNCHTAAEWKQIDASRAIDTQDRSQLQRMTNQGLRQDGPG